MKIGFVAVSRVFWEWPDSCHLEGVNRCSSGGRETAAATAARGAEMGAFGRASDRLRPRGDGERIPPFQGGKGGAIAASLRGLSDRVLTTDKANYR